MKILFSCMTCELLEPLLNLDKITKLELSSREEAQFHTIQDYLKQRGEYFYRYLIIILIISYKFMSIIWSLGLTLLIGLLVDKTLIM